MKINYDKYLYKITDYVIKRSTISYFSFKRRLSDFKSGRGISRGKLAIILAIMSIVELILWLKFKWLSIIIQLLLLPFILKAFDIAWIKDLVDYIDANDPADSKTVIFSLMGIVFSTINDIELNTRASFYDDKSEIVNIHGKFIALKMSFSSYYIDYYVSSYLNEDYCKNRYLLPITNTNSVFMDINYLIDLNEDAFVQRLMSNNLGNDWKSIQDYKQNKQFEEIARRQEVYEDKINSIVKSKKAKEIVKFLDSQGKNFGLSLWNLNKRGIVETDNALVIRCILNGDMTISKVKKSLATISKKVRVNVVAKELADKGSINLVFQLNEDYHGRLLTVSNVVDNAKKGTFDIGKGDLGEIVLKLPHEDFPATLLGGLSRSGKSTLATMLITSILSMQNNGIKDYQDVFIGTVKTEDYSALKWNKKGMYISGTPQSVYEMLQKVDSICTARKELFIKSGVVNIKQYNAGHEDTPLSKMLIVVDEYANLLSRAESEFTEVDGKKVKLSSEIERLCVKIAQEHISRGATLMIITQNFAKGALGKVYDAVGAKMVGYAPSNVASSLDSTQELANAMKGEEQTRKGLFFINAPDLVPVKDTLVNKMDNGFYKVRTNYLDTNDVKNNFNNTYQTANKYQNDTISPDNDGQGVKRITSLDDI